MNPEVLDFINDFIVEQIFSIDPNTNAQDLQGGKVKLIKHTENTYVYYYGKNNPLMMIDLNLLLDGV